MLSQRSYREPSEADLEIAKLLAWSDRKELGCHTGTISDAFLELWKAGKLTNARKEVERIGRMRNVISINGGVDWILCDKKM